jgi:hypothetical protein
MTNVFVNQLCTLFSTNSGQNRENYFSQKGMYKQEVAENNKADPGLRGVGVVRLKLLD